MTDPHGRIPREGFTNAPRTASEFAEYYLKSPISDMNREDMASFKDANVGLPDRADAYKESALAEHAKNTREKS